MGDTEDRKGKYEEIMMSKFMKSLCKIAIPVTLQSMLQASFSIVDQIMIGQLGETNISAVGLCGNFSLIFSVVIGAVSTVGGILIAQFIGAEDTKEAWCGFDVSLICGILISGIFMLASGCFFKADSRTLYYRYKYYKHRYSIFQNYSFFLYTNGNKQYFIIMAALQRACYHTISGKLWSGWCKYRT